MDELVDKLAGAVASGDLDAVDDLWLELLETNPVPAERLEPLLGQLVAEGHGAGAVDLVLSLAPDLVRAERYAEALPLLRGAAPGAEGNEDVRAGLIDCYRHLFRHKRHITTAIDRSGLLTSPDLAAPLATLERLLSYEEGDYFYHASGWGLGQIVGFDPLELTATIDFTQKPGHSVPLEHIDSLLVRLAPDDFRVLRSTDPEGLATLARDDPAALVRKALAARDGRATLRGLRGELHGEVVPADEWSKWWTRARAELRRDPHVDIGRGSNPVLTLRDEALAYEDEMRARFDRLVDLAHQTQLLREYARHRAKDADPAAFLGPAAEAIAARLSEQAPPGDAFEAALLLTHLGVDAGHYPTPSEILGQQADPIPLLNGVRDDKARRHAMKLLGETSNNWKQACHEILLRGPSVLWDAAVAVLAEDDQPPSTQTLVEELLENPKRNLDLFSWLARGLLVGRLKAQASPKRVFELLLTEGDELARQKAERRPSEGPFEATETLGSVRQAIRVSDLAYFDAILEQSNETEAARLLFRVRQSSVLTDLAAHQLERKIIRRFPRLLAEEEKEAESAGPEFIYATQKGIDARRQEHDRLANVELPEIEKRIGEAAAMGDISDNADWRTAIEERGHLVRRITDIADELQRAKPIEPAMVHTDHVSIGSRVTLENAATAEQTTYVVLGPWDADPDHHVMSYTAPLARALMRHKVGEEVSLEHAGAQATYRILAIESALGRGEDA